MPRMAIPSSALCVEELGRGGAVGVGLLSDRPQLRGREVAERLDHHLLLVAGLEVEAGQARLPCF